MSGGAGGGAAHQRFPEEVKRRQGELSGTARRFLEFVEERPECLEAETYRPIQERQDMLKYSLQPWPVFVSHRRIESMARASIAVTRLVKSLCDRVFEKDVASLMEFYDLETDLMASYIVSEPNGIRGAVARCDVIDGAAGPQVLELNCGSYLGGWQCSLLAPYLRRIPALTSFAALQGIELQPTDSVRAMFAHLVADTVRSLAHLDLDAELNLCILLPTAGAHAGNAHPLAEYGECYAAALAMRGAGLHGRVVACTADELRFAGSLAYLGDLRLHAVMEQNLELTSPAILRCFKAGRLNLFTGPASRILTDKRNLAILSELADSGLFDAEERALIARHVPWTRRVVDSDACYGGRTLPLAELVRDHQAVMVLKEAMSSGGEKVHVGRACSAERWQGLLAECLATGRWIVQEFVDTDPWYFQHDELGCCPYNLVWGLYVFGDDYGGCLSRMVPQHQGDVVNVSQGARVGLAIEVEEA